MTFSVTQKTKCPTGSPVLFHDFSDPGSDKVEVKRKTSTRHAHRTGNKVGLQGVTKHVYMPLAEVALCR